MTLLPLPRGSRCDRKRVSRHDFQISKYDTHHASRFPTLGLTKAKAKRTFWDGKLSGGVTALWLVQLNLASAFFEALSSENSLGRKNRFPASTVCWSIRRWKYLNWWIADKFNWQILTKWGYRKWRTIKFLYRQSLVRITVKLLGVLKTQTKFSTTVEMLRNWFSCTEVTV